jgi:predicted molibdopterin-dependent oxidoreductase YjgC
MVKFTFEGRELEATEGQSLAAALLSHGDRILRDTRHEERPRGVFCGIGICFDCLVVVDGKRNQRSCITLVHEGMKVEVQHGA